MVFFWALKKSLLRHTNPLANAHYVMVVCRRIFIMFSLIPYRSGEIDQPLLTLCLGLFPTLIIMVNCMWNRPFKMYGRVMGTVEGLYGVMLVVMMVQVVQVEWAMGWAIWLLMMLILAIILAMSARETVKALKINYTKIRAIAAINKV